MLRSDRKRVCTTNSRSIAFTVVLTPQCKRPAVTPAGVVAVVAQGVFLMECVVRERTASITGW